MLCSELCWQSEGIPTSSRPMLPAAIEKSLVRAATVNAVWAFSRVDIILRAMRNQEIFIVKISVLKWKNIWLRLRFWNPCEQYMNDRTLSTMQSIVWSLKILLSPDSILLGPEELSRWDMVPCPPWWWTTLGSWVTQSDPAGPPVHSRSHTPHTIPTLSLEVKHLLSGHSKNRVQCFAE